MLRRQARQRREYLHTKAAEAKEYATHDRKRRVSEAIEQGKPVPTELRGEADKLRHEAELDGSHTATDGIDSEYANAGVADPKVLVTTSHDPSSKLTQFLKEMKLLLPNSERMNRGGNTVQQIVETCRADGFTDLVVLQEHRGVPDGIVVSHMPYGPTAYFGLHNVVMRHDIPECAPVSEAFPHLVLHNLTTRTGKRVGTILKNLFPVPKADSRRVVSLINRDDFISFRHHVYTKDKAAIHLMEAGPRFELKLYQIKLGTIEQTAVDNEWVLRPYQNSSKRKRVMGE
uniref:Brix domain-containing protein n=1 Tax=Haptolina brevifila TaxID=156173 RepID=A0A7S2J503_9EUKA|mmetsp:Transcript_76128/g.150954  ORF Transcript_76128/g.150954 Transcript_76128/m.150954 type:complete len:287 (+) Transcript_76128:166-1026(+)|eukprot:CAMPEP_0174727664 /NCGR_PEP_ID=MMETSP1094-20130205/50262_1 /TAXON_ID=156173 /ORGANISM="Chrysochromulina brevifilum, Strain UTEX LB 985" /LENGTH=286 /DNA_ID=CAMNT_0015929463 /DNA_START=165 /DNA_END=1025 /DNA_ORIENTATION=+